jgi:hypothetical protein
MSTSLHNPFPEPPDYSNATLAELERFAADAEHVANGEDVPTLNPKSKTGRSRRK